MNMAECSTCSSSITSSNQSYASCDIMGTYSKLCQSMPDMSDCKMYSSMCSSNPSLSSCSLALSPPPMKMYFHTGILDYVLFESWVPRTIGQYTGAIFFIFCLSFGVKGLEYISKKWEREWKRDQDLFFIRKSHSKRLEDPALVVVGEQAAVKKESSTSTLKPMRNFLKSDFIKVSILRGGMQFLINSIHLLVMLIAMTFNVGFFLVCVLGLTIGAVIFTPLSYELQERGSFKEEDGNAGCC